MQLSHFLAENGTPADEARRQGGGDAGSGTGITGSALTVVGKVPGIDAAKFQELAEKAKAGCPVSQALGAIKVSLDAVAESEGPGRRKTENGRPCGAPFSSGKWWPSYDHLRFPSCAAFPQRSLIRLSRPHE